MAYGPFLHLWLLVFFSTDKDTSLSVTFLSSHISFFRLYMWVSSTSSVIVFFPFLLLSRISRLRDVFFDRLMGCRFVQPQSVMRAFDPTFHAVYGTFRPVSFVCRAVWLPFCFATACHVCSNPSARQSDETDLDFKGRLGGKHGWLMITGDYNIQVGACKRKFIPTKILSGWCLFLLSSSNVRDVLLNIWGYDFILYVINVKQVP